ncbi:cell wall-active antibiotics response protein LiaF [Shouchella sp. JSM 1781072]|uniref:cell wall-active antibiotics response protein LiaF n=1 Tax=Shouchella sp. JSM 1781072 TaxID=3344581 RepID=UPI0035C0143A
MKRNRTDIVAYIFFALLAATALELLIKVGPFILLVGSAAMIYYGLKRMSRQKGKFLFYGGLGIFILTLLSSSFFLLILFGGMFYMLYLFWEKASKPNKREVKINEDAPIDRRIPFVKNILLGDQQIDHEGFRSDDINIHTGIGTTEIHFEKTVLPKGDTVVVIRGFIGRVKLYVPYDAGVSVEHASLFGQSDLLGKHKIGFNQNVKIKNDSYEDAPRRLRIYTSLVAGDIEVMYR